MLTECGAVVDGGNNEGISADDVDGDSGDVGNGGGDGGIDVVGGDGGGDGAGEIDTASGGGGWGGTSISIYPRHFPYVHFLRFDYRQLLSKMNTAGCSTSRFLPFFPSYSCD